jgi:hypothetical protein
MKEKLFATQETINISLQQILMEDFTSLLLIAGLTIPIKYFEIQQARLSIVDLAMMENI